MHTAKKILLYYGSGITGKGPGILKQRLSENNELETFSNLNGVNLSNYSVIVFPGGCPIMQQEDIRENVQQLMDYVLNGGKIVGICAGAYLFTYTCERTCNHFANSVGLRFIDILSKSGLSHKKEKKKIKVELRSKVVITCDYVFGPIFPHMNDPIYQSENIHIIGIFKEESGNLNDPIMKDSPAVIRKQIGKGEILLSSCHFETVPALQDLTMKMILFDFDINGLK